MRTLKALALVLGATGVTVPAALAQQTAPGASDPTAGAQQETMPSTTGTGDAAQGAAATSGTSAATSPTMSEQQSDQVLSDEYIGAPVVARSDQGLEEVGTVSELVLGPDDKIVGVVVDVGGFLGIGAKPVGLSWEALAEERGEGELLLKTELTRQDLESAPEFKTLADTQVESDQQMMEGETVPSSPAQ